MTLPDFLSHLAVYRGLPVPFTVAWFDGVPDFKVTSPNAVMKVVLEGRCGLCGLPVDAEEPFVFIGGEMSLTNRLFTDPGMHERCARWAMQVCPFLAGQKDYATTIKNGSMVKTDEMVSSERPSTMGFLFTDGYRLAKIQGHGDNLYIFANTGKVELVESQNTRNNQESGAALAPDGDREGSSPALQRPGSRNVAR